MINIKQFFSYQHLFGPTSEPMKYGLYFFILFGAALLTSLILYFLANKKPVKFQKDFYRKLADSLFYLPIISILYLFARKGAVEAISSRAIFLFLLFIWLIWLIFLLYYRLAVVSRLYLEYGKKKREENYLRHGKSKR